MHKNFNGFLCKKEEEEEYKSFKLNKSDVSLLLCFVMLTCCQVRREPSAVPLRTSHIFEF